MDNSLHYNLETGADEPMHTRRQFKKVGIAATAMRRSLAAHIDPTFRGVELGIRSYGFRDFPLNKAIAAMKEIGIGEGELYMAMPILRMFSSRSPLLKPRSLHRWQRTTSPSSVSTLYPTPECGQTAHWRACSFQKRSNP